LGRHESPRAFRLEFWGEELLVVSVPLRQQMPSALTSAEQEVARALARGASNADIARERASSVYTVANQVASILRKLGVASRSQIVTKLASLDLQSSSRKKASRRTG
jgi:DNA-binding NarL/FixJ family response regulator